MTPGTLVLLAGRTYTVSRVEVHLRPTDGGSPVVVPESEVSELVDGRTVRLGQDHGERDGAE